MLFNSLTFLVFLAAVYALYRLLPFRGQNWMLLGASYIFYGWWDWRFLFLMIVSTSVDFWTGLVLEDGCLTKRTKYTPAAFLSVAAVLLVGLDPASIARRAIEGYSQAPIITSSLPYVLLGIPVFFAAALGVYRTLISLDEGRRRKASVIVSVVVQLTILGFFKYFNFFTDSLAEALESIGLSMQASHLEIVLPVGISFYTFQSMSYAIDIYRRELKPTDRFFDFALFVSFFPQLVAGPIERARNLLPQISSTRTLTGEGTRRGVFLIVFGLFKKVAIADGMAITADQAFSVTDPAWSTVVIGTLAFAIQIYCDFSGYSDIARGVSKLFGVELMQNFNQPYFARSPREFWQRWHISLSTWLSDYLYKPIGGSRGSLTFTCRNLLITMVLGGLWHGAAWNYVFWGLYHGTILSVHRVMLDRLGAARDGSIARLFKIIGFGVLTLYGWLLFRARSFEQIETFTIALLTARGSFSLEAGRPALSALVGVALLIIWEITQYLRGGDPRFYRSWRTPLLGLVVALMLFLTLMGTSNEPAQFIYFQF